MFDLVSRFLTHFMSGRAVSLAILFLLLAAIPYVLDWRPAGAALSVFLVLCSCATVLYAGGRGFLRQVIAEDAARAQADRHRAPAQSTAAHQDQAPSGKDM